MRQNNGLGSVLDSGIVLDSKEVIILTKPFEDKKINKYCLNKLLHY